MSTSLDRKRKQEMKNEAVDCADTLLDAADSALDEGSKYIRKFLDETRDTRRAIAKYAVKIGKIGLSAASVAIEKADKKLKETE